MISDKKTPIIQKIIIVIIVISAFISCFWIGYYGAAIAVGILGGWFGIELYKKAGLNLGVLLKLCVEAVIIIVAFALAFCEVGMKTGDAIVVSFQNLFHFTIINIPQTINDSAKYKIFASLQGFIGYILVVSGVGLLIKKNVL